VSPSRNTGTVPALEQQFMTPVSTLRSAVYFYSAADRTFLLPTYFEPQRSQCENACDLFLSLFMSGDAANLTKRESIDNRKFKTVRAAPSLIKSTKK
jgi:hypothetical protein